MRRPRPITPVLPVTPAATRPVRSLATFVVGAALLAGLAGCGSSGGGAGSSSTGAARRFTVVLDWSPNTNHGGMYLAKAKGWYRDAGLDVRFVEPGDASSLQLLAAGKADVAVSVQEELIPARAEGLPVRSVAAIVQHNTSSLVSPRSDGISRPRDLEGKTYGGYGGPLETALVDKLVSCDGGDPKRVKKVEVGEADYRIGFERNQYDSAWIFDGWDGIRLAQLDHVALDRIPFIDHTDCIPDWYTPLLATSDRTTAKRAADLRAFLAATARGYRAAMADPAAAADALLAAAPDLDRRLVERSARYLSTRYADDPARWGRQSAAIWDGFAAFLTEAGLVAKGFATSEAWTNAYLPAPG
jgi:ABC-type nitrate/sulfonate/bicarbonate transport system substrate-binding protein